MSTSPTASRAERLLTPSFLLSCLVTLTAFTSFYFLLATLPLYVDQIGGSQGDVGLVMGTFAVAALLLRPFIGQWSDRWGPKRLIVLGAAIMAVAPLFYIVAGAIPSLLVVRVLHGIGWAAAGTAATALVAQIAPVARRGEAMGYFGVSTNLAMALGPAMGIYLLSGAGFTPVFVAGAAVGALSLLLSLTIEEPTRVAPTQNRPVARAIMPIERRALFPSAVLFCFALTYGSVVSFLPLFAVQRGIENPGLFFTVYAVAVIGARSFSGRLSDVYGRAAAIIPGLLSGALALGLLSLASGVAWFLAVALFYGLAFALIQPALSALAVDRVDARSRGAAMGTFSAAMDLGIGLGSFGWGYLVQATSFEVMYLVSMGWALVALAVFVAGSRGQKQKSPLAPA